MEEGTRLSATKDSSEGEGVMDVQSDTSKHYRFYAAFIFDSFLNLGV